MLTIILPTYNEMKNPYFQKTLTSLGKVINHGVEIIAVDSNSTDGTKEKLAQFPLKLINTHQISRAERLNIGVKNAHGNTLLLHHPRSLLSKDLMSNLINQFMDMGQLSWGGFTHQFDHDHYFLKLISYYSNNIRVLKKQIVYLDHCIFLSSFLAKKIFPIPRLDIFEDTIISQRLAQFSSPTLLPFIAKTSAIRFVTNGIYKQWFTNQLLKLFFHCGISHQWMNRFYEKNCNLNLPKN